MATTHDASPVAVVTEVLDDDTRDLFRRLLRDAVQQLIEAELTATIGAAPHERTDTRTNWRNGGRERLLSTPAGDWSCGSPSCVRGRSSRLCWSRAAVSTRRCGRW